jgi:hypothetical protein
MRGDHSEPDAMFSYISPAHRVPKDHPLRAIRVIVDEVLRRLWSDFESSRVSSARTARTIVHPTTPATPQ